MRKAFASSVIPVCFCLMLTAAAMEPGMLPLRPGEVFPQPPQRGMDEIEALPNRETICPVCSYNVLIPDAGALMRRGYAAGPPPAWRPHAASRDADLCPYPGPGKLAFRADIALCPRCGYAAAAASFDKPIDSEVAHWVRLTLAPSLRAVETALAGMRAAEMREEDVIAFFNRQEAIPDTVRTEHFRVIAEALPLPLLAQAEATWEAAWALRREIAGRPNGAFLAGLVERAHAESARREHGREGVGEEMRFFLARARTGRERLPEDERAAIRFILAGLCLRLGFRDEAERYFGGLYLEARERFLRAEQDPFWQSSDRRAAPAARAAELDAARAEMEAELAVRLELLVRERDTLLKAAELVRAAMLSGELDDKPAEALFHAYLVGEFLRRSGNLPLASEWFKNVLPLTAADSPLRQAAEYQLRIVREQAGDRVNLLSALGQDGELFERLRRICAGTAAAAGEK